jgi:hypothetical protein
VLIFERLRPRSETRNLFVGVGNGLAQSSLLIIAKACAPLGTRSGFLRRLLLDLKTYFGSSEFASERLTTHLALGRELRPNALIVERRLPRRRWVRIAPRLDVRRPEPELTLGQNLIALATQPRYLRLGRWRRIFQKRTSRR